MREVKESDQQLVAGTELEEIIWIWMMERKIA